jgi:predicted tellurium resistance membrane protein TerC
MKWCNHILQRFIDSHPTIKMLALGSLLLIGITLMVKPSGSTFKIERWTFDVQCSFSKKPL